MGEVNSHTCLYPFLAGRYQEAVRECRNAVERNPTFSMSHTRLGLAYAATQRCEEAVGEMKKAEQLAPHDPRGLAALAYALAACGRGAEARRVLAQMNIARRERYFAPYWIAAVHAVLGDREEALRRLEEARQERDMDLFLVAVDPRFAPLRNDPRYAALLSELGLR